MSIAVGQSQVGPPTTGGRGRAKGVSSGLRPGLPTTTGGVPALTGGDPTTTGDGQPSPPGDGGSLRQENRPVRQGKGVSTPASLKADDRRWRSMGAYQRQKGCGKGGQSTRKTGTAPWLGWRSGSSGRGSFHRLDETTRIGRWFALQFQDLRR